MNVVQNPYSSKDLEMTSVEAATMWDSPSHSNSTNTLTFEWALAGHMQGNPLEDSTANTRGGEQSKMIVFEEDPELWIPLSFNQAVHEETLRDEQRPYVLWATLKLNIPLNPKNAVDVVFNGLADFINAAMEEDKQFAVFPYSLSEYNVADELPLVINNVEMLPEEVEDWLQYFPDAKPCR